MGLVAAVSTSPNSTRQYCFPTFVKVECDIDRLDSHGLYCALESHGCRDRLDHAAHEINACAKKPVTLLEELVHRSVLVALVEPQIRSSRDVVRHHKRPASLSGPLDVLVNHQRVEDAA